MKACPFCAEEIQDAAIVCKHCGRELAVAAPIAPAAKTKRTETTAGALLLLGLILAAASSTTAGFGVLLLWVGIALAVPGSRLTRWGGGFLLALLLGGVVMSLFGTLGSPSVSDASESSASRAGSTERATTSVLCEREMRNRLRSPGSADFPFFNVMNVEAIGNNQYRMASYVDSQNAFGALIRTRFVCVVEGQGRDMDAYKIVGFNALEQ